MSEHASFADLLRRVRAGDEQAAAELVRTYESVIRREVRLRLRDARLRRLFDSQDVCQSVLLSFFLRMASGQYDVESPAQLVALLVAMARNKLAVRARAHRRQKRDAQRQAPTRVEEADLAADTASPSQVVVHQELLHQIRSRLTEEERRLADRRGDGRGWAEIAAELGGTPDGRRMQLARALDRVTRELGLEESGAG